MTSTPMRPGRLPEDGSCHHRPPCPDTRAPDRAAPRVVASHPEQGWSLLCNGVLVFDDGGELLLMSSSVAVAMAA